MIIRAVIALGLVGLVMGHNVGLGAKDCQKSACAISVQSDTKAAVMARLSDMRQDLHQARAGQPPAAQEIAAVSRDAAIQVAGFAADHLAAAMTAAIATPAQASEKK